MLIQSSVHQNFGTAPLGYNILEDLWFLSRHSKEPFPCCPEILKASQFLGTWPPFPIFIVIRAGKSDLCHTVNFSFLLLFHYCPSIARVDSLFPRTLCGQTATDCSRASGPKTNIYLSQPWKLFTLFFQNLSRCLCPEAGFGEAVKISPGVQHCGIVG